MHIERTRQLNTCTYSTGPILYWMSRDQRVEDNWALIFAQELALRYHQPLIVAFCLRRDLRAHAGTRRMLDFMLTGLASVEEKLRSLSIPFFFVIDDPTIGIPALIEAQHVGAVVCDFLPLRTMVQWKKKLLRTLHIPFYDVDAHNCVPCWIASDKQEFAAYTFRPKIERLLPKYLDDFPRITKQKPWSHPMPKTDWKLVHSTIQVDEHVGKVEWVQSGEHAAHTALQHFLTHGLDRYATDKNTPTVQGQSQLSPYLHFGQLSAQRVALEISQRNTHQQSHTVFLEELIVRKELSDNFCHYCTQYDTVYAFPLWAQHTLQEHVHDPRGWLYTYDAFATAQTHDPLWNAAQMQMVITGKMHGYLRMYWAKKILEWTKNPSVALRYAIRLNDTYSLDGRDPNGYVGIAWSIGGVHDRAWFDRPIFGKIRYMNENGAKKKFDVSQYIQMIENLTTTPQKR